MGNMSYCKFRNTLSDMRECEDYVFDMDLSKEENTARIQLVKICKSIASDFKQEKEIDEYFTDNKDEDEEED